MTQTRVGWRSGISLSPSYILDTYGGAAAAYSLRKLISTYSGPSIRVRRSSDNAEQDIAFDTAGNLDTNSLLSFVGANNQALYSEEFDNAYWNKYITTVTSNQTTAPDGTMTADLLAESTTNNYHTLYNATSLSFAVGTSWNVSVYVKKGPGTSAPDTIILGFPSPTGNVFSLPCVLFNISSGTVLDSSNASNDANFGSSIIDAGNGWWRCSVWGTVTVTGNRSQVGVIRFNNNLNTLNTSLYPGNVQSNIYIWGYQFQKALNNTSVLTTQPYSKTTTTTLDGNGFVTTWYDQSGNSNTRANITAANQPQIVSSGSLLTINNKPTMFFDGINDNFIQQTPALSAISTTVFSVFKLSTSYSTSQEYPLLGGLSSYSTRFGILNNKWFIVDSTTNTPLSSPDNVTTGTSLITGLFSSTDKIRVNNSEVITGNSGNAGSAATFIGRSWLGKFLFGNLSEMIIYASDKTTDIDNIENAINNYYSIYTPTTPSLSTGLFGIWNGNGTTNDSYSTLTGEARGGLTYSIGKNGSAFTFNGSNTTTVAFPVNSWTTGDNFSFSLWFNVTSLSGNSQALISNYSYHNPTMTTYGWGLRVVSGGLVFQRFYPQMEEYSGGTPVANQWQHAVVTRNGSVTKIYLNGDLVGGKYSTAATVYSNTVPRIGARMDTDTTNPVWQMTNGSKIDEVYIWNRAITDVEVKELYNSGNGKYYPFN
jgi:hypothetical protein